MPLGSPPFVLLFFPLALALFTLAVRHRPHLAVPGMVAASLLYCAVTDWIAVPLLLASIVFNHALLGRIQATADAPRRRRLVTAGVVINLLPLMWFKFFAAIMTDAANPAASNDTALMTVGIPLGLAFYTLQQITALFDIQRPGATRLSLPRFALMTGLFAQLPAGPIFAYRDAAPQHERLGRSPVAPGLIAMGLSLMVCGLVKKAAIADPIGSVVDALHAAARTTPLTLPEAWYALWGFLLQLYFDFSAYSDIAIGIGLCFGLRLPVNFNAPLQAASAAEYINRWHMSLVAFAREYVFHPVFRTLRGLPIRSTAWRHVLAWAGATLVAYIVIGAWHSPTLAILAYGLLVGVVVVLMQLPGAFTTHPPPRAPRTWRARWRRWMGRAFVLSAASLIALLFRAGNDAALHHILHGLGDLSRISISPRLLPLIPQALHAQLRLDGFLPTANLGFPAMEALLILLAATLIALKFPNTMTLFGIHPEKSTTAWWPRLQWRPTAAWGVLVGTLLSLYIMLAADGTFTRGFIYERF